MQSKFDEQVEESEKRESSLKLEMKQIREKEEELQSEV